MVYMNNWGFGLNYSNKLAIGTPHLSLPISSSLFIKGARFRRARLIYLYLSSSFPIYLRGIMLGDRTQVDCAGACAADVQGYISQVEVVFAGVKVADNVRLHVERSGGWRGDWSLIETEDEIMVFCPNKNLLGEADDQEYVDLVREAFRAMRNVVAAESAARLRKRTRSLPQPLTFATVASTDSAT